MTKKKTTPVIFQYGDLVHLRSSVGMRANANAGIIVDALDGTHVRVKWATLTCVERASHLVHAAKQTRCELGTRAADCTFFACSEHATEENAQLELTQQVAVTGRTPSRCDHVRAARAEREVIVSRSARTPADEGSDGVRVDALVSANLSRVSDDELSALHALVISERARRAVNAQLATKLDELSSTTADLASAFARSPKRRAKKRSK